jgi:Cys-tRNA(Pro)/Cys-tRNA(Cys) deacylase
VSQPRSGCRRSRSSKRWSCAATGAAFIWQSSPENNEVDGKALARLTGDRKVELVPLKEVQQLTGYIRGGVTALGAKREYPVYADEMIELFDVISVSAGVRGTQVLLSPGDYLRAVSGKVAAIGREK